MHNFLSPSSNIRNRRAHLKHPPERRFFIRYRFSSCAVPQSVPTIRVHSIFRASSKTMERSAAAIINGNLGSRIGSRRRVVVDPSPFVAVEGKPSCFQRRGEFAEPIAAKLRREPGNYRSRRFSRPRLTANLAPLLDRARNSATEPTYFAANRNLILLLVTGFPLRVFSRLGRREWSDLLVIEETRSRRSKILIRVFSEFSKITR